MKYDCVAAALEAWDDPSKLPRSRALHEETGALERRLLLGHLAPVQEATSLLRDWPDPPDEYATRFDDEAKLLLLARDPAAEVYFHGTNLYSDHVLSDRYGSPMSPLERAALESLEQRGDLDADT